MSQVRRSTPPPPIHAYEYGTGDHDADRLCRCQPRQMRSMLQPGQLVYVHGVVPDRPERPEREGMETATIVPEFIALEVGGTRVPPTPASRGRGCQSHSGGARVQARARTSESVQSRHAPGGGTERLGTLPPPYPEPVARIHITGRRP